MEAFMNGLLMTESSADRYERFMAFIPCLKKTAPLYRDFKVLEKDGIAIYTAPVQGLVQDLVQQYENLTSLDNDTICLADGDDANATVFSVKSFGEAATGSGVLILVLFGVILLLVFILCIVVACYESKLNRVVRKEHFPLRRARSVDNLPREIPYAIYRTEGQEGLMDAHVELAEDQDVPVDDPVQSDPKEEDVSVKGCTYKDGLNLPPLTTSAKDLRSMLYAQTLEFYSLKGKLERSTLRNQLLNERLGALHLESQLGTEHLLMSCENANVKIGFEELSLLSNRSSSNSYMSTFLDPSNF